jgi:hypothetical protein
MVKNHMKKCSPSLAIKETQIKITLRFHLMVIASGLWLSDLKKRLVKLKS